MAISLKEVEKKVHIVEQHITAAEARQRISTISTCSNTKKLNGQGASYYRCNYNCSWTTSGG